MSAPTVFVVDDEPDVLIFIKDYLEAKGYRVWVFSGGRDVIDALDQHVPDLILLDIMMPEMNGYEVCRAIRERSGKSRLNGVKICFVSAKTSPEDVQNGLAAGADAYMGKPFDLRSLIENVQTLAGPAVHGAESRDGKVAGQRRERLS